ncbi:MAG: hypothetical protein WD061_00440 [Candidatus Saccharimonadales bacterium]
MATKDAKGTRKIQSNNLVDTVKADNWLDLANHFQVKVQKRTSEVAFLHTKAGFLIAAAVIELQVITGLPKFDNSLGIAALCVSIILAFASLIFAIISMHISKSATPLNPDKMILDLTERPEMTREQFGNWLAKSYALANKEFNELYNRKYWQQITSAILLVVAFIIIIMLKGINIYV